MRNASDGADARRDAATRTLCTNIKANNQILLIVVGYGVEAEAHRQLLKDCATSSAYYFETADPTQLAAIFKKIGQQLVSLRLLQ